MHAMLALSASELREDEPSPDLTYTAIQHRILAIRTLSESISRGCHSSEEGNAMIATCYALIHQSALLDDGICEFMSFTRGLVKVLFHMGRNKLNMLFRNIIGDELMQTMGPYLEGHPVVPIEVIEEATLAIQAIEKLCQTDGEKRMYECILELVTGLAVSKRAGMFSV